jgi:hypothetical protein
MQFLHLAAVVVALLLVVSATPAAAAQSTDDTIDATYTVSHDPDSPAVAVTMAVVLPDRVTAFTTGLPLGVEVVATEGFTATSEGYEWDGETATPIINYRVPEDAARSVLVSETYAALTTGNVVGPVSFRYRTPEVGFERDVEVAGSGAVNDYAISLWTDATTRQTADGTTVTVVAPPDEGPDAVDFDAGDRRGVADAVVAVDDFFRFDRTEDRVVVFPRPSDAAGLEGAVAGRANGAGQVQLEAARATEPRLVAHEWVHTQQDFRTTAATDWFVEGSADYLGFYYAYHASDLSFQQFRERLTVRDEYADVNLRELTNATERADYEKGRHVAAGLDATLRERSDGAARLGDALVALRERDGGDPSVGDGPPVGSAALVDLLSETAGSSLTAYYGTATGPQAPPQLPTDPAVYDHDGTTQVTGTPTPTSTATATTTATATPTSSPPTTEPTATPGQPGLGPLVALAALVAVGLVRRRTG